MIACKRLPEIIMIIFFETADDISFTDEVLATQRGCHVKLLPVL